MTHGPVIRYKSFAPGWHFLRWALIAMHLFIAYEYLAGPSSVYESAAYHEARQLWSMSGWAAAFFITALLLIPLRFSRASLLVAAFLNAFWAVLFQLSVHLEPPPPPPPSASRVAPGLYLFIAAGCFSLWLTFMAQRRFQLTGEL